jgi:ubiquitin carboxyl-terminal hydrolase 4/11/15
LTVSWTGDLLSSYRPNQDNVVDHHSMKKKKQVGSMTEGITLDQCFQKFTKSEKLDEENLWYCATCKKHRQAIKTMELWKVPDVLILSLKRFEYR